MFNICTECGETTIDSMKCSCFTCLVCQEELSYPLRPREFGVCETCAEKAFIKVLNCSEDKEKLLRSISGDTWRQLIPALQCFLGEGGVIKE